jgi:hypothetical protein
MSCLHTKYESSFSAFSKLVLLVFHKLDLIKSYSPYEDIGLSAYFTFPRRLVQVLYPPQKFKHLPFWNG